MTTPEASTPSPDPSDSAATPTPPPENASSSSSTQLSAGILGFLKGNTLVIGSGTGVVIIIIVVVVALLFTIGGGGPSDPEDYVLDDTSAVSIANVAAIVAAPTIPAQLAAFTSLGFPNVDPEDLSAWMEAWEAEWADDFPRVWGAIGLEDITTAVIQEDEEGRDLGWIFFGEFAFEDIRESLEDAGRESDTYRDFEIWGDNVALLEDRGALLVGPFVQDVLKALDTERGFVDDTSVLKLALDEAGDGLALSATSTCSGSFFQVPLNGCDAVLEVVMSGDTENTVVLGTYVFTSDNRAESGMEDIEDAIEKQDTYDADLNQIETDGQFVSYEMSIVGEFVGGVAASIGGDAGPLSYTLEDISYVGMLNVAAIMDSPEIPAQLVRIGPVELHSEGLDEAEEWKEEWEDSWDGFFLGMVGEAISLSDITHVLYQRTEDGALGILLFGEFAFEDVREFLEEEELEEDTYRSFELWDEKIALLEDRGLIAFNSEDFVKDLLKALDTGEGFLDESSSLKTGLTKAGEGLTLSGSTNCTTTVFSAQLRSCDVVVQVIKGGDPDTTELSAVYVFSSERRAESGMEDLEDAIEDQERYDVDLEKIEVEGEFVTYDVTIHE